MRPFFRLLAVLAACSLGMAVARADTIVLAPLVKDAAASDALWKKTLAAGRCYATDLDTGTKGTAQEGRSQAALPPGRYRLHMPVALSPLGDLKISAIQITVAAGNGKTTVQPLHFVRNDEFIDVPVEFVTDGGHVPFTVSWEISGASAAKNRIRALDPDAIDPEEKGGLGEGGEALAADAGGAVALAELAKLKYHLAIQDPHIEPLSPVVVSEVTTDKIVYKPGEAGTAQVTLRNTGNTAQSAALTIKLGHGLAPSVPLGTQQVELGAESSKTVTVPFKTDGLYWGAEIEATAQTKDGFKDQRSEVFAVAKNIWETAIVAGVQFTDEFFDRQRAEAKIKQRREEGYTAFEAFFWAPDDFGDFTPETEYFLGGQTGYRGSVTGTKNLVAEAHKAGMAATVYANLWGGGGAAGIEMVRRHPDWFSSASFNSYWLEMWPAAEQQKIPTDLAWATNNINQDNSLPALQAHAEEFIESHKRFGWDATRYDSYYTTDWNKMATKVVKETVNKVLPDYQWGYNTFVGNDEKLGALEIMVGGGGLAMEESVRSIAKNPESFARYEGMLASYRDMLWPRNGHLAVCYDRPQKGPERLPLDEIYLSSLVLATGSHPYYNQMESQLGNYPRFALRYSDMLYNNRMRALKAPEEVISFGGAPKLMDWKRLARRYDMGEGKHRLILHLINTPAEDLSLKNFAAKTPLVLRNLPISLKLPADAVVSGAWNLCPIPAAGHQALKYEGTGGAVKLAVPEVRFWNVVVIDYTSKQGLQ